MKTPCYICGNGIDEIQIDPRDLKPKPCYECLTAIEEALEMFGVDDDFHAYVDESDHRPAETSGLASGARVARSEDEGDE